MRNRIIGIVAGVALLAAFGMSGVIAGGAAVAARHPAQPVAVARPDAVLVNHAWRQAPTTELCELQFGIACYDPSQFQTAYNLKPLYAKGLNGTGRTIVIVDSYGSPTIQSDLATFDRTYFLPAPPSFKILQPVGPVPPFDPTNGTMVGWAVETSLDVEYSHAMAPGANIVLIETPVAETEGAVGLPQIIKAENWAINNHIGDVISQSFGATEESFRSTATLLGLRTAYVNAASHGVTVLASAGDTGATNYRFNGLTYYTHPVVGWPSSDPLVTSVGGLQLHLNSLGEETAPDNVWNDPPSVCLPQPCAGSGGLSHVFSRPAYQNGVRQIVGDWRGTPDISLSAAVNGAAIVYLGFGGVPAPAFYLVGGTSEASPQFAGIVAIADQAAGHDLGLLNPALYQLGESGAPGIVDITAGDNTVTFPQHGKQITVQGWDAVPGYDLASGNGTINAAELVPELAGG